MERRYYQRIKLNIDGLLFLVEHETFPREFNGTLEDISECGIKVVLDPLTPKQITDSIAVNDRIQFNSYDEYELFGNSKKVVLSGKVIVVRKDTSNGKIVLGCKLSPLTDDLSKYISEKKSAHFANIYRKQNSIEKDFLIWSLRYS